MKYYSDYTIQYVNDILEASNIATGENLKIEDFESLTKFIHEFVVRPPEAFSYFDERGLVNRGKCPYTGQLIDKTFPKWTFMGTRSIYLSHEGFQIMRNEEDIDFEKVMGYKPNRKKSGCYIATICYGDEYSNEVIFLKQYRDTILVKSLFGRAFITIYYFLSPTISKYLTDKHRINRFLRTHVLDKLIIL